MFVNKTQGEYRMKLTKNSKKTVAVIAAVIVICSLVGGTIAFLFTRTEKASNTFTIGNIDITLTESEDLDFHMESGKSIEKDPIVTVKADSIESYLYVEIEESDNLDTFISYELANGWIPLGDAYSNIYYRETEVSSKDETYHVLKGDKITVNNVSDSQMNSLTDTTLPKLTFAAYAIQKDGVGSAVDAWSLLTEQYAPLSSN